MIKSVSMMGLAAGRLLGAWGDKAFMAVVIVVTGIGVSRLEFPATRPSRELEADDCSGSGTIVHYELLHVWLPPTFVTLAADQAAYSVIPSHQELRRFLERRGQENLWYAVMIRGHQANGGKADITFIRRPYDDAEHFSEFREMLATGAGNPPLNPTSSGSAPGIHIMEDEHAGRIPRQVIERLLSRPAPVLKPAKTQHSD